MQKIFILIAIAISSMSLVSCGNDSNAAQNDASQNTPQCNETTVTNEICKERIIRVDRCIARKSTYTSASYTVIFTEGNNSFYFCDGDNVDYANVREGDFALFEKLSNGEKNLLSITYVIDKQ